MTLLINLIWFVFPPALDRGAAVEVFKGDEGEKHSLLSGLCDIVIALLLLCEKQNEGRKGILKYYPNHH